MKVKSIVTGVDLTKGKIYEVIDQTDEVYLIECDSSGTHSRYKKFFEIVNDDQDVEEEKKCMKTMKRFSLKKLMKLVDLLWSYLLFLFTILGIALLLYPLETLEQLIPVLQDSTMRDSLKVFPYLWLVLSLVEILIALYPWCRKMLLRLFRR